MSREWVTWSRDEGQGPSPTTQRIALDAVEIADEGDRAMVQLTLEYEGMGVKLAVDHTAQLLRRALALLKGDVDAVVRGEETGRDGAGWTDEQGRHLAGMGMSFEEAAYGNVDRLGRACWITAVLGESAQNPRWLAQGRAGGFARLSAQSIPVSPEDEEGDEARDLVVEANASVWIEILMHRTGWAPDFERETFVRELVGRSRHWIRTATGEGGWRIAQDTTGPGLFDYVGDDEQRVVWLMRHEAQPRPDEESVRSLLEALGA